MHKLRFCNRDTIDCFRNTDATIPVTDTGYQSLTADGCTYLHLANAHCTAADIQQYGQGVFTVLNDLCNGKKQRQNVFSGDAGFLRIKGLDLFVVHLVGNGKFRLANLRK